MVTEQLILATLAVGWQLEDTFSSFRRGLHGRAGTGDLVSAEGVVIILKGNEAAIEQMIDARWRVPTVWLTP